MAVQELRARVFRDDGQPPGGRTIHYLAEIYGLRPVIVISETLAQEYWREPSRAIGKRVRYGPNLPWREIVGVVGDERDDGLESTGDGDGVLAAVERLVSGADDLVRGAVEPRRDARLHARAAAGGVVRQRRAAARGRADPR